MSEKEETVRTPDAPTVRQASATAPLTNSEQSVRDLTISRPVENVLKFLNLTKEGKFWLSAFPDKVVYKAQKMLVKEQYTSKDNPFSIFVALCIYKCKDPDIMQKPNWEYWEYATRDDANPDMTHDGHKYDDYICRRKREQLNTKKKAPRKKFLKGGGVYKDSYYKGPTFDQGVKYYKYGQWYKYPDQAIDKHTAPTQPSDAKEFKLEYRDPVDQPIEPLEELRKAIRTGKINKKGLAFLRTAYVTHNPEIVKIIDAYLNAEHCDQKETDST